MNKLKTVVVMPGYNAEATFKKTILDIPFEHVDEIVFVDDASTDQTVKELRSFCLENPRLTDSQEEYKGDKERAETEDIEESLLYIPAQKAHPVPRKEAYEQSRQK